MAPDYSTLFKGGRFIFIGDDGVRLEGKAVGVKVEVSYEYLDHFRSNFGVRELDARILTGTTIDVMIKVIEELEVTLPVDFSPETIKAFPEGMRVIKIKKKE